MAMAQQATGSAQTTPLSNLSNATGTGSPNPDASQIPTPGRNAASGSTFADYDDSSHVDAEFRFRWERLGTNGTDDKYTVDIVTVPAVGGRPMSTWCLPPKDSHSYHMKGAESVNGLATSNTVQDVLARVGETYKAHSVPSNSFFGSLWIFDDISNEIGTARILAYTHGKPEERCTIDTLSTKLLDKILEERKTKKGSRRPLFFMAHSTGGLVVKAALIKARGHPKYEEVGYNCYGVAFFGSTPHQGSSYLSSPTYSDTVKRAMGLQWSIPPSFQKQLKIKADVLVQMAREWMPVAAELKIWSFYETIDTNLTDSNAPARDRVSFQAPLTSIKSAILELHHEVDRPVQANHADCAAFGPENEYTKRSFLRKLGEAASQAWALSLEKHVEIKLDNKIEVEVHGFYESGGRIPSDKDQKIPIRLWSTSNRLDTFLKDGPAKCLQSRLKENTLPPTRTQMLNSASSRRPSFLQPTLSKTGAANKAAKEGQSSKGKLQGGPKLGRGILSKMKGSPEATAATEASGRRFSSPSISRSPPAHLPSASVPDLPGGVEIQRRQSGTPSVLVSEHDNSIDLPLSPSPPNINETIAGPDTHQSAELRHQSNSGSLSVASNIIATSTADQPQPSIMPSGVRNERLSPSYLPPQSTLGSPSQSSSNRQDSDDSGAESTGGEVPSAPPIRPEPESQKLVWIHLAYNNPKWVSDIFSTLSKERGTQLNDELLHDTVWCKRHIRGRNTHYHACFVKPGCILIHPEKKAPSIPPTPKPESPMDIKISLYLPYLHWDTYRRMVKRREFVKRRLVQGRSRPTPENIGTMDMELIVAWKYLGYDPPFHTRRTLDQFGYPNLSDTRARDDDQMLYKRTNSAQDEEEMVIRDARPPCETNSHGNSMSEGEIASKSTSIVDAYSNLKDGKVLMVDQVWLWIVDNATLVTFFPQRQAFSLEGKLYQQADLRNSIYNEVNADLSRPIENSLDLAALVALHSVTLLFERASHRDLEIFRIFEEAISILVETLTKSFKYFRAKGFQAVADNDDSDDDADAIREHHKEEGKKFQNQVRQNVSALLELRDISDELLTLKKLFDQQQEALNVMLHYYENFGYKNTSGCDFLREALSKLKHYLHRIQEMTESAEHTRNDFEKLLNLVQRQASVDEARRSRWQVDLQTFQSRAIFIFTVFTIFFLPLSFFTGVFGMNTSQWAGPQGQFVSLTTIAEYSLPLSFAIFGGALTLALSTPVWRRVKFAFKFVFKPLEIVDRESVVEGTNENSIFTKKVRLRKPKKTKKTEDYHEKDFWEGNQVGKEDEYEIPERNRQTGEQVSDKRGSWKSSHRTWSWKKGGKKPQDKKESNDPSLAEP